MKQTISVPEIHCDHCKHSIEGAVGGLDGVAAATVDIDSRTVEVDFAAPATIDAIVEAIEGQGYDVPAKG